MNEQLANDVAAASAAYLIDCLPEILGLPAHEVIHRLELHIHTAIVAYLESTRNWDIPEPSRN
jgi:hypothetical protein